MSHLINKKIMLLTAMSSRDIRLYVGGKFKLEHMLVALTAPILQSNLYLDVYIVVYSHEHRQCKSLVMTNILYFNIA